MSEENPVNFCRSCGEDFATVYAFDEHRTGVHAYTYSEGLKQEPPVEDGRRCFGVDELVAFGWSRKMKGLWQPPKDWISMAARWDTEEPEGVAA